MIIPGLAEAALDASGKEGTPNVLLVGTSCPTQEDFDVFVAEASQEFGALGANVVKLHEFGKRPSKQQIKERVGKAAVIWGGFGDTLHAMDEGKTTGVNQAITEAALAGTVIGGGSAGMLASLKWGHSDSLSYRTPPEKPDDWEYIFVEGMGLVEATGCPHYNTQARNKPPRRESFMDMLRDDPAAAALTGLGIDNEAVLHLNGSGYRILSRPGFDHGVYLLNTHGKDVQEERLPQYRDFAQLPTNS